VDIKNMLAEQGRDRPTAVKLTDLLNDAGDESPSAISGVGYNDTDPKV
jgi:hypothetical protein